MSSMTVEHIFFMTRCCMFFGLYGPMKVPSPLPAKKRVDFIDAATFIGLIICGFFLKNSRAVQFALKSSHPNPCTIEQDALYEFFLGADSKQDHMDEDTKTLIVRGQLDAWKFVLGTEL